MRFLAILLISHIYLLLAQGVDGQEDDTVTIEARPLDILTFDPKTRPRRQTSHPASSIFAGFPGFDGKGFEFPSLGTGFVPFPPLAPKPVTGSCQTKSGISGKCVQLSQCFPLLFSSAQEEVSYGGLAYSIAESAGTCQASNTFLDEISSGNRQKAGICCGSEDSKNIVPKLPVPFPTVPPLIPTSSRPIVPEMESIPDPYNCAGFYVIGGTNVAGRPYPWIVSIKDGRTNRHVCGGSLISPRSVLSAAHCVQSLDGQRVANIRVYLGTNDITATGRCTVVKRVKNIKYHRGFSMKTLHHDIAILTLESPVPMGNNIQTVSLGTTRTSAGTQATVAGWGGVQYGGGTVGQLRHVNLDVITNNVCAAKYIGHAPAGIIQQQLCAGSPGRDSCVGDSGGPLMQNGVQIGVVSFGVNCGVQPGVYTRVASYLSWINKNKS